MMNKKEREIVGQIYYVACDKRSHVEIGACIGWFEKKMKEIRRLCKLLPKEKCIGKKKY